MAKSDPRKADQAWRHGASETPGSPTAQPYDWQQGSIQPPHSNKRMWRRLLASGALALVVGGIALLIWMIWPLKPVSVVLVGTRYDDQLAVPHNMYGYNGLAALSKWAADTHREFFGFQRGPILLHEQILQPDQEHQWDSLLDKQHLDRVGARTAIVVLSLHGGADDQGCYLLPKDVDPSDSSRRIRLKEVVSRLTTGDLKDRHILLVLDTTQMTTNDALGMLYNDFVAQLRQLEPDIKKAGNLAVLCASDDGQRSWESEEWGETIFLHYVAEGLRGPAGNDQDRVTALSLYDYVKREVEHWVRDNRFAKQTPVLIPAEADGPAGRIVLGPGDKKYQGTPSQEAPGIKFQVPEQLERRWEECQELAKQSPPPATSSPVLWRLYLDWLLRYEQLVRAETSDHSVSADVGKKLSDLHNAIERARRLSLSHQDNALPLRQALGWSSTGLAGKDKELENKFAELWVSKKKAPAQWSETQKWASSQDGSGGVPALQNRFLSLAIQKVATDPSPDFLVTASELVKLLYPQSNGRPAEGNYLYQVYKSLAHLQAPGGGQITLPGQELVKQALDVRLLAEQVAFATKDLPSSAYPYAESVYPWVREDIENADLERGLGQDLFFATRPEDRQAALKHLQTAQGLYEKASKQERVLQEAYSLRDRVLAELPYYAQWLARRPSEVDFVDLEKLWDEVHQLTDGLDKRVAVNDLGARTARVHKLFQKVKEAFDTKCKKLDGDKSSKTQERWQEVEMVLVVPFIPSKLRRELVEYSRGISDDLNRAKRNTPPIESSGAARLDGLFQGRAALYRLGANLINDQKTSNEKDLATLLGWLAENDDWKTNLAKVGHQIGHHWQTTTNNTRDLIAKAREDKNLGQAQADWANAERLSRMTDGAQAARIDAEKQNPGERARAFRFYSFLLWQKERALADHWYDETDKPYYLSSGRNYWSDAFAVIDARAPNPEPSELTVDTAVKVNPPAASLWMTSELEFRVPYTFQVPAKVSSARPVLVAEIPAQASSKVLLTLESFGRLTDKIPETVLDTDKPGPIDCSVKSPYLWRMERESAGGDAPADARVIVRGVYRGSKLLVPATVKLYSNPDLTICKHQDPDEGGIAVRADDEVRRRIIKGGTISIVIDYSGSMKYEGLPKEQWKITKALRVLRRVLKRLPDGVSLSVWVFGQKGTTAQYATPEESIRNVWKAQPWKQGYLDELMAGLEDLEPQNFTPLVRSMAEAFLKDLKGREGFRTLLVLTDGMDTRFVRGTYGDDPEHSLASKGDPEFNSKSVENNFEEIGGFLKQQFDRSGVAVNMVFFDVPPGERQKAREQFAVIKDLAPIRGNIWETKDLDELEKYLLQALNTTLRFQIEDSDHRLIRKPGIPDVGFTIDEGKTGYYKWFAPLEAKGNYFAVVQAIPKQEVGLAPGDRLLLNFSDDFGFERALFSETLRARDPDLYSPSRRFAHDQNWQAAIVRNMSKEGLAELWLTMESTKERRSTILQQIKPALMWLEAGPEAGPPHKLRWGNFNEYPAPAYRLQLRDWPASTAPVVSAWPADEELEKKATANKLRHGPDTPLEPILGELLQGSKANFLSVQYEPRWLETKPDKWEETRCLIVRINYGTKKTSDGSDPRVLLRLPDLPHKGEEHRYYDKAGTYTAIFWDVDQAKAEQKRYDVKLISIEQLKKAGTSLKLNPGAPNPNDPGEPRAFDSGRR
jgi:hypothetical protein